jgi:hypothetical protein
MNISFVFLSDAAAVEPSLPVSSSYILLIRRYRVTSGTTLLAMMAPSPTAAASSIKIFICQVSLLTPTNGDDQRSLDCERCST